MLFFVLTFFPLIPFLFCFFHLSSPFLYFQSFKAYILSISLFSYFSPIYSLLFLLPLRLHPHSFCSSLFRSPLLPSLSFFLLITPCLSHAGYPSPNYYPFLSVSHLSALFSSHFSPFQIIYSFHLSFFFLFSSIYSLLFFILFVFIYFPSLSLLFALLFILFPFYYASSSSPCWLCFPLS